MKQKAILSELSIILFGLLMVFVIVPIAAAQGTDINVMVGPAQVTDVCPNIDGVQGAIPAGMIKNPNGNCVTPTPPPVDVCPNIDGLQTSIPNGYYKDGVGKCVVQQAPAVDVCPNIFGLQLSVPAGLNVDGNGNCVAPPVDECQNIEGIQETVPAGMDVDNGICYTPAGTISPPNTLPNGGIIPNNPSSPSTIEDAPSSDQPAEEPSDSSSSPSQPTNDPSRGSGDYNYSDGSSSSNDGGMYTQTPPQRDYQRSMGANYTGPDYQNVPEVLDPVVNPIVQSIPKSIRKNLQSVPPAVARTVPYYIIGVLGIVTAIVAFQSIVELMSARALIAVFKRDKDIADQKDNFIALASHYLRTPLTLMRNGLDTIVALKELPASQVARLRNTVNTLEESIKAILEDIENDKALKEIKAPSESAQAPSVLHSKYLWGPIIGSALLILLSNFLLGVVGDVDLGTMNQIFQAVTFVAIGFGFYAAIRTIQVRRKQKIRNEELIAHEHIIDEARNAFIERSTTALHHGLTQLYNYRPDINSASSSRFFDEGYKRFLEMLEKFLLLGTIQTGKAKSIDTLNLRSFVDTITESFMPQIQEKNLTVVNKIDPSITVSQNRALYSFIIQSLIDNAIKFNNENGTVTILADSENHLLRVSIADNGMGIPEDKKADIFKPFNRVDSAIEFNYEGLGFSLFLDKIITDYLGGEIKIATPDKGGTEVSISTPPTPQAIPAA